MLGGGEGGGYWGLMPSSLVAPPGTLVHTSFTQVMTAAATAFRRAMLEAEPRLAEAMYLAQVGV